MDCTPLVGEFSSDEIALQIDSNIPKALITGDLSVKLHAKFNARFGKPYSNNEIRNLHIESTMMTRKTA